MQGREGFQYETVKVRRSEVKAGMARITGNIVSFTVGFFGMIIGLICTITIIGAIVGIPIMIGSLAMLAYPFIYEAKIECPNCGKKRYVRKKQDTAHCIRCKVPMQIEWID
ncbi:hypothetical protein AB1K91_18070 [Terribacillus sp. 179-K 1B1 HS]|uniref:hypothetical protein n=1 Tax=Terribacillus sp. 179-K 1B1 HS TaxID=3142388 RepID=UPI0039A1CD31